MNYGEKILIPWRSPENFRSVQVSVHTQIKFEVWESGVIIITILNFAKNMQIKKLSKFLIPFMESMPKMSQKRHFGESNQKATPKNA